MLAKKSVNNGPSLFYSSLSVMLNQKHPLFVLAGMINWTVFEEAFAPLYCLNNGRPAKPIRLMVGLLLLKHLRNVSDESIVEQWAENNYYQYFCGELNFMDIPTYTTPPIPRHTAPAIPSQSTPVFV